MADFNYDKAVEIHEGKYDYSEVQYVNIDTKVKIICPEHGEFSQSPYSHINRKQGCPKCRGNRIRKSKRFNATNWIEKAHKTHSYFYEYSSTQVKNAHEKTEIICPIHGSFWQNFNNHIYNKCGCPDCGYNVSKQENEWLDSLEIPHLQRQKHLMVKGRRFKVDGYDPKTKTVYEFLGYFWHGHPDHFNPDDINPRCKKTFGELYETALEKLTYLRNNGLTVVEKWG